MFSARAWNIILRTVHIAAMGVFLGGHAYGAEKADLQLAHGLTAASGVALGVLEAGGRLVWFHQGRGLMTLAKLGLLGLVSLLWGHPHLRLAVLLAVVVLASVGSHMPARFRYYSVLRREVIPGRGGPGVGSEEVTR